MLNKRRRWFHPPRVKPPLVNMSASWFLVCFFVLETIRTGAMRVIHIPVKTEETQRLRIKFVLHCPICALNLKIKRTSVGNKTVKCSMPILRASRSAIIAEAFLSTRPP